MKILFIHQNFPAQFKALAPALVEGGHDVVVLTPRRFPGSLWQGVRVVNYKIEQCSTPGIHRWLVDFESKTIRAEGCFRAALKLKKDGYSPDLIISHPGWGESLFLSEVWPYARLRIYCEFYYQLHGSDVNYDPEFQVEDEGAACRLQLKNINNLLHFEIAEAGLSPTHWQAQTFPLPFRERISVIHEGIDTDNLVPNPQVTLTLNHKLKLTRRDEIITFVSRNLEPYRGYHTFMRGLPEVLRQRPRARILLVGGDKAGYGGLPPGGGSWKEHFIREVKPQVSDAEWQRIHFLGTVSYANFLALLQLSSIHVYLTYPFVLSWSLLEAMSVGCTIVASNTPPLQEAIKDNETGRLVDFFAVDELSRTINDLLDDLPSRTRLSANARDFARAHYDLRSICLPAQMRWVTE